MSPQDRDKNKYQARPIQANIRYMPSLLIIYVQVLNININWIIGKTLTELIWNRATASLPHYIYIVPGDFCLVIKQDKSGSNFPPDESSYSLSIGPSCANLDKFIG